MTSKSDAQEHVPLGDESLERLIERFKASDDGSNHFTRLVAPLLAAFTLPTVAQLVTSPGKLAYPWLDLALALFVASTGLLLAGFQLSIGRFNDAYSLARPILAFGGVGVLVLAIITLVIALPGITPWIIGPGLAVLTLGAAVPIIMRIHAYHKEAGLPNWLRVPLDNLNLMVRRPWQR